MKLWRCRNCDLFVATPDWEGANGRSVTCLTCLKRDLDWKGYEAVPYQIVTDGGINVGTSFVDCTISGGLEIEDGTTALVLDHVALTGDHGLSAGTLPGLKASEIIHDVDGDIGYYNAQTQDFLRAMWNGEPSS